MVTTNYQLPVTAINNLPAAREAVNKTINMAVQFHPNIVYTCYQEHLWKLNKSLTILELLTDLFNFDFD